MLDIEGYKDFVQMSRDKKDLEAKLDKLKKEMQKKMKFLIDNLQSNDMDSVKIAGKNCYIHKTTVAVIKNRSDAIDVLRKAGYEDYVKEGINNQSVSKLVRDLLEEKGSLPTEFGDTIKSLDIENLRVKAA